MQPCEFYIWNTNRSSLSSERHIPLPSSLHHVCYHRALPNEGNDAGCCRIGQTETRESGVELHSQSGHESTPAPGSGRVCVLVLTCVRMWPPFRVCSAATPTFALPASSSSWLATFSLCFTRRCTNKCFPFFFFVFFIRTAAGRVFFVFFLANSWTCLGVWYGKRIQHLPTAEEENDFYWSKLLVKDA